MNTLRALIYADARSLVNQLKSIRRSPVRAIMWALFGLLVVGGIVFRFVRAAHHESFGFQTLGPRVVCDGIVCFIVIGLGISLALGSRFAGLFAHAAEARFIIGSPATPFVATMYVQARDIFVNGANRGFGLLWAAVIYLPGGLGAGTFVRDLLIILGSFAAVAALPLARQLLGARAAAVATAIGFAIALIAVVPVVRDAAAAFRPAPPLGPLLLALPRVHPGTILLTSAAPQYGVVAGLLVCLIAIFAFVAFRARDAYPELYELSMNRIARVERMRTRMLGSRAPEKKLERVTALRASSSTPGGVAIFVWRAWTEYRRTSGARSTAIETALLLIAGYAVARISRGNEFAFGMLSSSLSTLLFVFALARSAQLAAELRRPLFWLSPATLFERLAALAIASGWRIIAWAVLVAIGLAAGRATIEVTLCVMLCAPAAALLAISVGYASYAVVPYEVDQRGPLMALRIFAGYAFTIPAIGVAIAVSILAHAPLAAIGGAAATACAEALVLIGFASWRLDRMSIPLR